MATSRFTHIICRESIIEAIAKLLPCFYHFFRNEPKVFTPGRHTTHGRGHQMSSLTHNPKVRKIEPVWSIYPMYIVMSGGDEGRMSKRGVQPKRSALQSRAAKGRRSDSTFQRRTRFPKIPLASKRREAPPPLFFAPIHLFAKNYF